MNMEMHPESTQSDETGPNLRKKSTEMATKISLCMNANMIHSK